MLPLTSILPFLSITFSNLPAVIPRRTTVILWLPIVITESLSPLILAFVTFSGKCLAKPVTS
nr:MAG TPA: hypothetical protein [Caudoviricetes sp.]